MAQGLPEGTITVLFTDVEGSTELTTRWGDDVAQAILRAQRELVRRQVEQHSGHEVKTMGDGFMVAFSSARRAVACAVGIQRALEDHNRRQPPDQRVRVRIGLNTGEAIHEEDDLFGEAVTAADRIAGRARGGQILVSDTVRGVIGRARDVELIDRGRFRLKGFPERWRLYEVVWQETAGAAGAPARLERTPFVGRDDERAWLLHLLDRAAGGRGALAMVRGEHGVGKTRLAEELLPEAHQRGFVTWTGRCFEVEGAPPYVPFVEILEAAGRALPPATLREALGDSAAEVAKLVPELRRLFPDMPPPMELLPDQERRYLFNCILEFLQRMAERQPLLLTLEDLHWADDSTLLLLQHISERVSEMPVLVLGTHRDVDLEEARPLARALEGFLRQRLAHDLTLRRLPETGVGAMLSGLSGQEPPAPIVRAVYGQTEGNPFFVEEVYQQLAEEGKLFDARGRWRADVPVSELGVPRGVRLVIGRRLERVSAECRRVLTAAAVIGRAFSFELLAALAEAEGDALLDAVDEAEQAHLITLIDDGLAQTQTRMAGALVGEARFVFAHELVRRTLLSDLSLPRRQRLHLRVAEAMEHVYAHAPEAHAADLAHHYRSAGRLADSGRVLATSRSAGDHALRVNAYPEAELHYSAALSAARARPDTPPEQLADLLHDFGRVQQRLGRWDRAQEAFDEAIDIYRGLGLQEQAAEVLLFKGRALTIRVQPFEALETLAAAKEAAGANELLRGLVLEQEAQNLVLLRHYAQAAEAADEALALSRKVHDSGLTIRANAAAGFYHQAVLDMRRAFESYSRGLETGASEPTLFMWLVCQSRAAHALVSLGRLDEAEERAAVAQQRFHRMGDPYEFALACVPTAMVALARGKFDHALDTARRALEESGDPPSVWILNSLLPIMVAASFYRGRLEEADRLIREPLVSPAGTQTRLPANARACQALVEAARGADPESVAESLPPVSTRFKPDLQSLQLHVLIAETGVLLRHPSQAESRYDDLLELFQRGMLFTPGWVSLLPRLLSAICIVREQWDEAERHLERACDVAEREQALPELALTYLECADLQSRRPGEIKRSMATSHLTEARRLMSDLGMVVWGSRLAAIEERLAHRQRGRPGRSD